MTQGNFIFVVSQTNTIITNAVINTRTVYDQMYYCCLTHFIFHRTLDRKGVINSVHQGV